MAKNFVLTDSIRQELTAIIENAVAKAMTRNSVKDATMNTSEVMRTLSISRATLWRMTKNGTLTPKAHRGKQLLFAVSDVKALVNGNDNK